MLLLLESGSTPRSLWGMIYTCVSFLGRTELSNDANTLMNGELGTRETENGRRPLAEQGLSNKVRIPSLTLIP